MQSKRARHAARIVGLALAALAMAVPSAGAHSKHSHKHGHHHGQKSVDVQLLGINDFHGQLEPGTGSGGRIGPAPVEGQPPQHVDAGGAEYLATHIRDLQRHQRNSLVVAAGDLIGASPLLSAAFHDEPTIEAMNEMGLDLASVGNHEFDEGTAELLRMQRGGCHPTDGCKGGHTFEGADFRYLSANVVYKDSGRPVFRPYAIKRFQGAKVGFIGLTLEGTPNIVSPAGIADLRFLDEADTINHYAAVLKRRHHVKAIVVLLHEGGTPSNSLLPSTVNACIGVDDPIGDPIMDIVNRTTQDVDLFMTGHTHQAYNCVIDGRPVTSASSQGRLLTDIDLKIDRGGDISQVSADNRIITRDVPKAADISALIAHYKELIAPIANAVVGRAGAVLNRVADPSGENALGDLIADAQLADTDGADEGAAVAAFMNPGGVRADIQPGDITYGEAFDVQPFSNVVTTLTLTGRQIWSVLQQQWCTGPVTILLPSKTVHYTWDKGRVATACTTNPVTELSIGGVAVPNDDTKSYRITVNNFLADGGDGFTALTGATNRLGGQDDLAAFVEYLKTSLPPGAPIAPPALDRIDVTG
jgi:5'-nucleotidase